MAEPRETLGSMRFGRFELSVDTGELRKDGVRLELAGQAIQVLAMLAANAGQSGYLRTATAAALARRQLW